MSYIDKWIEFMNFKKSFLPKEYQNQYFNEQDEKLLKENENEENAKIALETILNNIKDDSILEDSDIINGFSGSYCPYCVIYDNRENESCEECLYQMVHRNCHNMNSDYNSIFAHFPEIPASKFVEFLEN